MLLPSEVRCCKPPATAPYAITLPGPALRLVPRRTCTSMMAFNLEWSGDILGHEPMGVVVEVGREV